MDGRREEWREEGRERHPSAGLSSVNIKAEA
jgi:hypothetical protein